MNRYIVIMIVALLLPGIAGLILNSVGPDEIKVAVMGDSLSSQGIWIKALNNQCGSNYVFHNFAVRNAGIISTMDRMGDKTVLYDKVVCFKDYDEVIVWLGINDAYEGLEMVHGLFGLAQAAVELGAKKVYILTLPPCEAYAIGNSRPKLPQMIRLINSTLLKVQTIKSIEVVDIWNLFIDKSNPASNEESMVDDMSVDGLHLSQHGNIALSMFLFNQIYRSKL